MGVGPSYPEPLPTALVLMLAPTRVVVVGVCMEQDRFEPFFGINKELNVQFVLGYTPEEFALTLHHLAEGKIDDAWALHYRGPNARTNLGMAMFEARPLELLALLPATSEANGGGLIRAEPWRCASAQDTMPERSIRF